MFDRIKAKEKSKTLLRTRSFLDAVGFYLISSVIYSGGTFILPILISILIARIYNNTIGRIIASSIGAIPTNIISVSTATLVNVFIITFLIGCIMLIISLLFQAGMNRAALRINRGDKNVRVLDIILAGDRLGRYIAITLWQALFIFLWNLPSVAVLIIAVVLVVNSLGSTVAAAFAVILIIAACIWSIYITINKTCQYYFAYCVAEDNRDLAALDCVRESSNLMVDHKWELFVTMLSFIGWDIVAATGIGSVFVSPYQYLTYTSIYEQLIGNFKPVSRSHMQWLHNGPKPGPADDDKIIVSSERRVLYEDQRSCSILWADRKSDTDV